MAETLADRDGWIWLDGELVPWREANVHVLTYTLHYGIGVFEGVRAYETPNGASIFRLREHTDRLFDSARIMQIEMPWSEDTILVFAREQGLELVERRITRDEFYIADEAFLTGTAAEVLPIRELDGRVIGDGKRGPVTETLQTLYFDQVRGRRQAAASPVVGPKAMEVCREKIPVCGWWRTRTSPRTRPGSSACHLYQ